MKSNPGGRRLRGFRRLNLHGFRLAGAQRPHDGVANCWREGGRGLRAPVAHASPSTPKVTTRGVRARDPFNRNKEGSDGLIHVRASLLRGEVAHETQESWCSPSWCACRTSSVHPCKETGEDPLAGVSRHSEMPPQLWSGQLQCVHVQKGSVTLLGGPFWLTGGKQSMCGTGSRPVNGEPAK